MVELSDKQQAILSVYTARDYSTLDDAATAEAMNAWVMKGRQQRLLEPTTLFAMLKIADIPALINRLQGLMVGDDPTLLALGNIINTGMAQNAPFDIGGPLFGQAMDVLEGAGILTKRDVDLILALAPPIMVRSSGLEFDALPSDITAIRKHLSENG